MHGSSNLIVSDRSNVVQNDLIFVSDQQPLPLKYRSLGHRVVVLAEFAETNPCEVKKSNVKGLNNGLFAKKKINKRTLLALYGGTPIKLGQKILDTDDCTYIAAVDKDTVFDAKWETRPEFLGRFANCSKGTAYCNNARLTKVFIEDPDDISKSGFAIGLVATRTIKEGDEIFIAYGRKYWAWHVQFQAHNKDKPKNYSLVDYETDSQDEIDVEELEKSLLNCHNALVVSEVENREIKESNNKLRDGYGKCVAELESVTNELNDTYLEFVRIRDRNEVLEQVNKTLKGRVQLMGRKLDNARKQLKILAPDSQDEEVIVSDDDKPSTPPPKKRKLVSPERFPSGTRVKKTSRQTPSSQFVRSKYLDESEEELDCSIPEPDEQESPERPISQTPEEPVPELEEVPGTFAPSQNL